MQNTGTEDNQCTTTKSSTFTVHIVHIELRLMRVSGGIIGFCFVLLGLMDLVKFLPIERLAFVHKSRKILGKNNWGKTGQTKGLIVCEEREVTQKWEKQSKKTNTNKLRVMKNVDDIVGARARTELTPPECMGCCLRKHQLQLQYEYRKYQRIACPTWWPWATRSYNSSCDALLSLRAREVCVFSVHLLVAAKSVLFCPRKWCRSTTNKSYFLPGKNITPSGFISR